MQRDAVCIAESSKGLLQLRQLDLAKIEAQERPWNLINDLQEATHPSSWNDREGPLIRVSVNLEPDSDCPGETRGVVVLKVVWLSYSTRQLTSFMPHASHNSYVVNDPWRIRSCLHLAVTVLHAVSRCIESLYLFNELHIYSIL